MSKRVCVFVDGENFRQSIVELFDDFLAHSYLPRTDWAALFDWIVELTHPGAERVRTYWYVVENLEFYPWKLPHVDHGYEKLVGILSKDRDIKKELVKLSGTDKKNRVIEIVDGLKAQEEKMKRRFETWSSTHFGIAKNNTAIEFRPAGSIRYNLFNRRFGTEKAVDVKLATDLLTLHEIYDIAVIVSGDQDYVPAVQHVKNCGNRVVNVAFMTRGGALLPGGARRLNKMVDASISLPYPDFRQYLKLPDEATVKSKK